MWSGGNIATRDSSSHSKVHWRCSARYRWPSPGLILLYSFITRSQLINYRAREIKLNLNLSASILTYFSPTLNQISIVHLYSRVTPNPPRYLQGRAAVSRMAEAHSRAEYTQASRDRGSGPSQGTPTHHHGRHKASTRNHRDVNLIKMPGKRRIFPDLLLLLINNTQMVTTKDHALWVEWHSHGAMIQLPILENLLRCKIDRFLILAFLEFAAI